MPYTTTRHTRTLARRIPTSVLNGCLVGLCLLALLTGGAAVAHFALPGPPAPAQALTP